MGKRGPPNAIEKHPQKKAILAAMVSGMSAQAIGDKYGVPRNTVETYRREQLMPSVAAGAVKTPEPPLPTVRADASPRDRAAAHCDYLQARLKWAQDNSAHISEKDRTGIAAQYTAAMRYFARVSGALDITEAQVVRSAPWARIMVIVRDALRGHPKALKAVVEALEAVESGEK